MGYNKKRIYRKNARKQNKKAERSNNKKWLLIRILVYMFEVLIVVLAAYGITRYGIMMTNMTGESMESTLHNGDSVLVNRFAYKFSEPERNDVIAYCQNSSEHNYLTIKRVIGLPGEKIIIQDGDVYINGEKLEEQINVEQMNTGGLASEEISLESDEYFVLGDNRNNSQDSRFSNVGTIVKDEIFGKVWIKMKPFSFIDSLNTKKDDEKKVDGQKVEEK